MWYRFLETTLLPWGGHVGLGAAMSGIRYKDEVTAQQQTDPLGKHN